MINYSIPAISIIVSIDITLYSWFDRKRRVLHTKQVIYNLLRSSGSY
jgi:hypothetical protein